ncbi:hypothetical protein BDR06DRAFT_952293 [Suillus hirtellus]|nr:hypothetical protein BDR06DRAFT_952293 [Suillus hirtellus]
MSIPTTELVIFDTTEEVCNDCSILSPAFEIVSKSDGIQMPAYVGTQIENPARQQPVTEVLLLSIENPDHRTEVFDILTKISDSTENMLVFGPTLENENVIIVVGGWQSVEAHWEMVANPEPKAALERLYTLANEDHLFHSTLTPFMGK